MDVNGQLHRLKSQPSLPIHCPSAMSGVTACVCQPVAAHACAAYPDQEKDRLLLGLLELDG